jgi:putative salt-induced outer membrane protein
MAMLHLARATVVAMLIRCRYGTAVRRLTPVQLAPLLLANAPDPQSAMIPETIRAMVDAAMEAGNETDVNTIVKYARAADPLSGDAVLAIVQKWKADRAEQRTQVIRQASFLDLWSGKAEVGGYLTTGNSDTAGGTAVLDLDREGLRWRHKFHAQADYQSNQNVTTREHYLGSYEPNYKIDDRLYIYGVAQYESDRFLGYVNRYSTSVGAGYSVVKSAGTKLDLEFGPAYRFTNFNNDINRSSVAARGTASFSVRILSGLSIGQEASAYVQRYNSTLSGTTSLNAKLIGPLSAALSYSVQYESQPPVGSVSTDTTSRASLVYNF